MDEIYQSTNTGGNSCSTCGTDSNAKTIDQVIPADNMDSTSTVNENMPTQSATPTCPNFAKISFVLIVLLLLILVFRR